MREILFRAKAAHTVDHEWLYGSVCPAPWEPEGIIIVCATEDGRAGGEAAIPETVGQFTGLTDKNGKKIFEGDLVQDPQSCLFGKVVYATPQDGFDGMAGFMVDDVNDGLQNYNGFWYHVEVVGNIHDKPEWKV